MRTIERHDAHYFAFVRHHVERAKERCERVGDCLLWTGAVNERGPVVTIGRHQYSLRKLFCEARTGKPFPRGNVATVKCTNPDCLAHAVPTTFSKLNSRPASLAHRMAVAIGKRRGSKLSEDAVREIHAKRCAGVPVREIAAGFRISKAYAYMILRGENRRGSCNPFQGFAPLGSMS